MTSTDDASRAFTGRTRRRKTSRSVFFADWMARTLITLGGIGTIVAVSTVCVFLLAVALPLFQDASSSAAPSYEHKWDSVPLYVAADEYQVLGWALFEDGGLLVFRLDDGTEIERRQLVTDKRITAHSFGVRGGVGVLGFDDGSFQFGSFDFKTKYFNFEDVDARLSGLGLGEVAPLDWVDQALGEEGLEVEVERKGVVEKTPTGLLRGRFLDVRLEKPKRIGRVPVAMIDHVLRPDKTPLVCALLSEGETAGRLQLIPSRMRVSVTTGNEEIRFGRAIKVDCPALAESEPAFVRMAAMGKSILLVWGDGRTLRYRYNAPKEVLLIEELDLAPQAGERVTALGFSIGKETLIVGTSAGRLDAWFSVPAEGVEEGFEVVDHGKDRWVFRADTPEIRELRETGEVAGAVRLEGASVGGIDLLAPDRETAQAYLQAVTADGFRFVATKALQPARGVAVTSIFASPRSRMLAVGHADGTVSMHQVSSAMEFLRLDSGSQTEFASVVVLPKEDGVLAVSAAGIHRWTIDPKYPGTTPATLFLPVWYEGYSSAVHMWQSSSGDDASEPKMGLYPLIYGTIKATLYTMLFGAPLALLAAVYSSEFLKPRVKARVKPTIELMASLPSVVLGFLAALVFAPFVENYLASFLALFLSVPLCFMFSAYLWQLLPYDISTRFRDWRFPLMFCGVLPVGLALGFFALGPVFEWLLFLGDMKTYLNGANLIPSQGSAIGGWVLLLLPISTLLSLWLSSRFRRGVLYRRGENWSRAQAAKFDLLRFLGVLVGSFVFAFALANIASLVFGESRGEGSLLNTYVQRNALVVGFIMGFAVIPIIYTIAEDALATVPSHLRSASLGAGATPWQTALRIVIPTAMSGLFSACMIGLGRAVGETMIVLMATGNTPIMQANLFNGFRTLSANIATELPEAAQGDAHYRTLFLAALVLFAMTFVLNTVAETVRLRFRKRAFEL